MQTIPRATYRMQLHAGFGFDAAAAAGPYLSELGISHLYSSPYLQAAKGSMHGYDVVEPHKVNEELGGAEAHDRFCRTLGEWHLGQILDIVPNHMAIGDRRNRYWWDVLENGPSSRYASYFDIEWTPPEEKRRNKMLMPILGSHYGEALAKREIQVARQGGEFQVHYFDHVLPAAPRSLAPVFREAAAQSGSDYLAFLADSIARLPLPTETDRASLLARHRDKEVIRGLVTRLCEEVPFIGDAIDTALKAINGDIEALDQFLEQQNYRLAYWRTAEQDLGYRRFFDVNTLVGVRMEHAHVFADTHALVLKWLKEGVIDGLRIDHPDGLRDPRRYFQRLREAAPTAWIVAEKILEPGEPFRASWPIDGATGYEFLNECGGLYVDPRAKEELSTFFTEFTGNSADYPAVCREKKHQVMRDVLGSDVNRLTNLLVQICERHRDQRDYTRKEIHRAIRELVACFPVYRTYMTAEMADVDALDETYLRQAAELAKQTRAEIGGGLFDFLADVLSMKIRGTIECEFVMRFQQFTGAVMAKGVEDTVFYCYNRLTSLNEVGGDPGRFGVSPDEFHKFCADLQAQRPQTMLASSTHDTKRSEDVRARISLLSEIPSQWTRAVCRWSKKNEKYRTGERPSRNAEYLLYQTMLGTWPISLERLSAYMLKASREAKEHTSWLSPDEAYEASLQRFVEGVYRDAEFIEELEKFLQPLIKLGRINSLSQMLLKLTAPGVPDTYQGTDLWDFSLVDPDNRRPVDYELRRRLLAELSNSSVDDVLQRADEGLPKLWTLHHALRVRRAHPEAFNERGAYIPLFVEGPKAEHLVAFQRGQDVVALAPRLVLGLNGIWSTTSVDIPSGQWTNAFTGESFAGGKLKIREALARFPVGLLVKQ